MANKKCTSCGDIKPIGQFTWNKTKKRYASWCKPCNAKHCRESRAKSPELRAAIRSNVTAARNRLKAEINIIKSRPCADCHGRFNPWQMQFDHVIGNKIANISKLVNQGCREKALTEISKCVIVCANCHADRTYKRMKE